MKTFADLQFKPHPHDPAGFIAQMNFDNGYGVSVVRFRLPGMGNFGSYTSGDNEWELAVLKDKTLCYDTPITSDVLGHLLADEVTDVMRQIQELPKA